jgi:hypothetical protein
MVNDYERQDFWKSNSKIKITKCNNEKSWYHDKVGQIFEIDSTSVRDYYVKESGSLKCILVKDAEIVL